MRKTILAAALLMIVGFANAQVVITEADSDANANSASRSEAEAYSGGNTIRPNQEVGVTSSTTFQQTFEAADIPTKTTQKFKTNNSVPLAAAVSFSSDYCGGTASGGASALGVSIGASAPKMDGNCQALRRAEKFGTAAANAYNAGLTDLAPKLIAMQVWEICQAGANAKVSGTDAKCQELGLYVVPTAPVAKPDEPQPKSEPTPPSEYQPRQPRGEVTPPQEASKKVAAAHTVRIRGSNGVEKEYEVGPDGRMVH